MKLEELPKHLAILENSYVSDSGEELVGACGFIKSLVEQWEKLDLTSVLELGFGSVEELSYKLGNIIFDFIDRCLVGKVGYLLVSSLESLDSKGAFVDHMKQWRFKAIQADHSHAVKAIDEALVAYDGRRIFNLQFDIDYAGSGHSSQCFDIYEPVNKGAELKPAILYFHGGAWEYGDRFTAIKRLRLYHNLGVVFISVGYRLSGEVSWPKPIEDCVAAANYVFENAESLGIDSSRIGVWGSSAGAHLGALVAGNLRNQTPRDYCCFVDFCGPIALNQYVDFLKGKQRQESPVMKLLGGEHSELARFAEEATVSHLVNEKFPASCIVHGEQDETVPYRESAYLDRLLKEAGVRSKFHLESGIGHRLNDFTLVGNVSRFLKETLKI